MKTIIEYSATRPAIVMGRNPVIGAVTGYRVDTSVPESLDALALRIPLSREQRVTPGFHESHDHMFIAGNMSIDYHVGHREHDEMQNERVVISVLQKMGPSFENYPIFEDNIYFTNVSNMLLSYGFEITSKKEVSPPKANDSKKPEGER